MMAILGCDKSTIVWIENVKKKEIKGKISFSPYFRGSPSQIMTAAPTALSQFPSPSLASTSIRPFSSVDHSRLISICFTVISHNSSIAATVPALGSPAPAPALTVCQPASARSFGSSHTPRFSGVFHRPRPNALLRCYDASAVCPNHCAACYVPVLLQSLLSFSTHFVFFQVRLTLRCHAPLPNDIESN